MKSRLAAFLLLFASTLPLIAQDPASDSEAPASFATAFLLAPVVLKAAAPFGMAVNSIAGGLSLAPAGALIGVWTVPNSLLLVAVAKNDAGSIRLWRTVNFVVDASVFAVTFGLGVYTLAQPSSGGENWNDLIGALGIAISVPFGLSAGIDLIPFPAEKRR